MLSLVPKPRLGNDSVPEAPCFELFHSLREAGASLQVLSQAGAWERENLNAVFFRRLILKSYTELLYTGQHANISKSKKFVVPPSGGAV